MKRVIRTGAELRLLSRARLQVRPLHYTNAAPPSPDKDGTSSSHESIVKQAQTAPRNSEQIKPTSTDNKSESPEAPKRKTVAEMDEELRLKLEGRSGEGGSAGIEYEGGKAEGLKRGVKSNMFRVI